MRFIRCGFLRAGIYGFAAFAFLICAGGCENGMLTFGPVEEKTIPIVAAGAEVEKLAGGFSFTEGPAADAEGNVYFTDIPNNRIHKWSVEGKKPYIFFQRELTKYSLSSKKWLTTWKPLDPARSAIIFRSYFWDISVKMGSHFLNWMVSSRPEKFTS